MLQWIRYLGLITVASPFPNSSELIQPYRVQNGEIKLHDFNPGDTQSFQLKRQAGKLLQQRIDTLRELQRKLFLQDRWALLVIIQGMDSSGKDSVIRHVMSGISIEGCHVHSFKVPTDDDLSHDFLWRYAKYLPQRGHIGIFNRSYYEDVLSPRVHRTILERQRIPASLVTDSIWNERFEYFTAFEEYLFRNGIVLCKIYLNVSKEEQRNRFLRRLNTPEKQWKFSLNDIRDRGDWDSYVFANEDMVRRTAKAHAPWYVVPADHKWFTRLVVAGIVIEALNAMRLRYPVLTSRRKKDISSALKLLRK